LSNQPARTKLPEITLVAVTSVALGPTIDALQASMREAEFGAVLLLSDRPPPERTDPAIKWTPIRRLASRADYSHFMLRELAGHISTKHALCVQWDGFALNGAGWDPEFLQYDYIGAVWPQFDDGYNVGNGGFSLRSTRLLKACKDLPAEPQQAEDILICRTCRPWLEERGMKFAPPGVARKFSYERTAPTGREFGFHGAFNLVRLLGAKDALRLVQQLERQVLTAGERRELLRWALARGRLGLALALAARLNGAIAG
jgi:hypothetical protein